MLSGIITGFLIVLFLAGWAWAWSPRRKRAFDEAARLPLQDLPPQERDDHDSVRNESEPESPR